MTRFPLDETLEIEVPSLGFGAKWRAARQLLAALDRLRRLGAGPATPGERLAAWLGLWRGAERRLEQENRLWRALFHACQRHAGYTRRHCDRLLEGAVTYAHRHPYEQLLLHGEAPLGIDGSKKNSAAAAPERSSGGWWRSSWNACASWIAACRRRGSSPRPTATSCAPAMRSGCAPASAFWIRRSRSPIRPPRCKCSPPSN